MSNLIKKAFYRFSQVYQKIVLQTQGKVGVIYLNSKSDLNALSSQMKNQIISGISTYEKNDNIRTILLLSKIEKAFCAGANIKDFQNKTSKDFISNDIFEGIHYALDSTRKPVVCGVNGVALGGGCQLALLCDIIVCSEQARFGLPQLKLGLIPGIGGTQRLTKIAGKVNAMRYILTSDFIPSQKALQWGLVSDVFKKQQLHQQALNIATSVATKPLSTLIVAKQAIKKAQELSLSQGVRYEREIFYPLFDTKGTKQGVSAFVQKRAPNFQDC